MEPLVYQLRVLVDGDPSERPAYRAVGIVTAHADTALLSGFCGRLTRSDVVKIYRELRRQGFSVALAERVGSHRLPFGELVKSGAFTGWWRVDLGRFGEAPA